jgi:mRNA-degrading endonuclease RelE of RelBE toxin-antitoxin system
MPQRLLARVPELKKLAILYHMLYSEEGSVANDTCRVRFLPGARKALGKIERSDPDRLPLIQDAVANVIENGWILSVHSALIKVLDQKRQIGEIRDMGSGGYRLFFCWRDGRSARTLFITSLEKKSKLKGKARVQTFIDSADLLCRRYADEIEEEDL